MKLLVVGAFLVVLGEAVVGAPLDENVKVDSDLLPAWNEEQEPDVNPILENKNLENDSQDQDNSGSQTLAKDDKGELYPLEQQEKFKESSELSEEALDENIVSTEDQVYDDKVEKLDETQGLPETSDEKLNESEENADEESLLTKLNTLEQLLEKEDSMYSNEDFLEPL